MDSLQSQHILSNISTVFQPIFDLKTGEIEGNEALIRNNDKNGESNPLKIIDYFYDIDSIHNLDAFSHEKSIIKYKDNTYHKKVFLNIEQATMKQHKFHIKMLNKYAKKHGIKKENIILEVCERNFDISSEELAKYLKIYKKAGYQLALDDANDNMISLNAMCLDNFDYMKISINLIKNINADKCKKVLLKSIKSFAKAMNIKLIAEGIETFEELKYLITIGIDYAQGYFIGRPESTLLCHDFDIQKLIMQTNKDIFTLNNNTRGHSFVGKIIDEKLCLSYSLKCKQVVDLFKRKGYDSFCFVDDNNKIVGYINRNDLLLLFTSQYSYSLYSEKPISSVFNASPLMVDYHTSIKDVLESAMDRSKKNLYDDIIVTNNNTYLGMVSIIQVIKEYNEINNEDATQLNPLTQLPGNNIISNNINKYMLSKQTVLFAYVDLSDFKVYNDFYGFEKGDVVIKKTAQILLEKFESLPYNSFVGHIGGDDYVCIYEVDEYEGARNYYAPKVLNSIIEEFEKSKVYFYNKNDYDKGYIHSANRQGKYSKCGLININIACYLGDVSQFGSLEEFTAFMAKTKRQSKKTKFSNFIIRDTASINPVSILS